MFALPPIPSWDALHPVIVHFPVALLVVAPIFVLMGVFLRRGRGGLLAAAWILMLVGTAGAFLAGETGEAAAEHLNNTAQVRAVLDRHESLAETTQTVFTILSVVFGAILLGPRLARRDLGRAVTVVLPLAFLVFYGTGLVVLANTAHNGGRLVHDASLRTPDPSIRDEARTSLHHVHEENDED